MTTSKTITTFEAAIAVVGRLREKAPGTEDRELARAVLAAATSPTIEALADAALVNVIRDARRAEQAAGDPEEARRERQREVVDNLRIGRFIR